MVTSAHADSFFRMRTVGRAETHQLSEGGWMNTYMNLSSWLPADGPAASDGLTGRCGLRARAPSCEITAQHFPASAELQLSGLEFISEPANLVGFDRSLSSTGVDISTGSLTRPCFAIRI